MSKPTHRAFYITSNPAEETEMWYGVYGHDGLLTLQAVHDVVPIEQADMTLKTYQEKHGANGVIVLGDTFECRPNFLGICRYGTRDAHSIPLILDQKYNNLAAYIGGLLDEAEMEPHPDRRADMRERAEDLMDMPDALLEIHMKSRRKEEEESLRPFSRKRAEREFQALLLLSNEEEICLVQDSRKTIQQLDRILTEQLSL